MTTLSHGWERGGGDAPVALRRRPRSTFRRMMWVRRAALTLRGARPLMGASAGRGLRERDCRRRCGGNLHRSGYDRAGRDIEDRQDAHHGGESGAWRARRVGRGGRGSANARSDRARDDDHHQCRAGAQTREDRARHHGRVPGRAGARATDPATSLWNEGTIPSGDPAGPAPGDHGTDGCVRRGPRAARRGGAASGGSVSPGCGLRGPRDPFPACLCQSGA